MNVVREIQRLNEREAKMGVSATTGASWHAEYRGHPYVFIGNVPFELTEGDLVKVFSQYVSSLRSRPAASNPSVLVYWNPI